MGEIIHSRTIGNKVKCKIQMDESEALNLKGSMKNVRLVSMDLCNTESTVIEKGRDGVIKHFSIPIAFRKKAKRRPKAVSCQLNDFDDKAVFVYLVYNHLRKKDGESGSFALE